MREKMMRFMQGRYGADQFSRFLLGVMLVCMVLSFFIKSKVWTVLMTGLLVYSYFRMFSRNIPKRYAENQKFLTLRYKVVAKWNLMKKHGAESKTHRFFKCPQCKQKVRVPKGRGKICITCPKCKTEFVKKS